MLEAKSFVLRCVSVRAKRDTALLLDMLLATRDALSFVEGITEADFLSSRLHQNAVIRSLEVIGEAAAKISAETRATQPGIPWREITGMRHRLIHGYAEVRIDLVWSVTTKQLVELGAKLEILVLHNNEP